MPSSESETRRCPFESKIFPFAPEAAVVFSSVTASVAVSVETEEGSVAASGFSPRSALPTGDEPHEANEASSAAEAANAVNLFVFILSFPLICIFRKTNY